MILYITFGQEHKHDHPCSFNNTIIDKDYVGIIHCISEKHGRKLAFSWFGDKFATTYKKIDNSFMNYFKKGFIELN